MSSPIKSLLAGAAVILPVGLAQAGVCDYKPSRLVGAMAEAPVTQSATNAVVEAGRYTLVNPQTGFSLLGSATAGGSAAGLAGGVSGFLSSAVAVLTAPATIVAGSITAVALGGYEGACYFAVERVTDRDTVVAILRDMEAAADPDRFLLVTPEDTDELTLVLRDPARPQEVRTFEVRNLYIADGTLLHRDRLLNTRIGTVVFVDEGAGETEN
ncbi:MAG: hypothetical protein AAF366_18725 [Pseudomonadota bacterium]